jgi:hypothetical protein
MDEALRYYGKDNYTESENKVVAMPKTQTNISYSSKDIIEDLPPNAVVKSKEVSISVKEIENGYLRNVNVTTHYCIYETDGEMEDKWHYSSKTYYMKEKPTDELLNYGI